MKKMPAQPEPSVNIASDLVWLIHRCTAFHPHARKLSRREISKAISTPKPVQSPTTISEQSRLQNDLDALFRVAGLTPPRWQETPTRDALPMVAFLPGIGYRIIYAKTPEGCWLLEGPTGSQQVCHLPQHSLYAHISASGTEKRQSKGALHLFIGALKARKGIFMQAALASFLANTLALAASLYSMQVYDRVIPTQGVATLIVLTVGVMIAAILELIVKVVRSSAIDQSIKGMDLELSHKIFLRLLGIRLDQFPASVGTLASQLRSYETIRGFASSATLYLAVDAPFALLFLAVILMLAGIQVAAVPTIFFLIALTIGLFYRRRIAIHARSGNIAANRKLGLLVETVENAETIKASGAGWQQLTRWDLLNRQSVDDDIGVRRYSEQANYLAAFMQQASYILLVAVGAWIASTSTDLTMGGLIACSILSGRVLGPVGALPGLIVQWAHAKAALENLEKVFALQHDNHDVATPLAPEHIKGEYRLSELRFTYPGRPDTLSISRLHISAGEKVAIIGPVGAGKSTLLKLLAGLYQPAQGRVLIDGLDIQQISRHHLSEHLGYCPQDVKLFSGTLRDNLLAGLTGINEDDILQACRNSGLITSVATHPKGLDLEIAEGGGGVSGGQKQLVALTRLLLSSPDVWLLDEPTAAMDEQTEQRGLAALRQTIGSDQTLVLVTHKPLLLALVNRLIVLAPTGIVLDGPRDQVLEQLQRNAQHQATQRGTIQIVKSAPLPTETAAV